MKPRKLAVVLCAVLSFYGPWVTQSLCIIPGFKLVMTRLHCERTTDERGHDEVFCIHGGINGDGQKTSGRKPGDPGFLDWADADGQTAWDMNDRGDKQDRKFLVPLYQEPLLPGQTANLAFVFIESDNTDPGKYIGLAGEIAQLVGKGVPIVEICGEILKFIGMLIGKNEDDVLGVFSLKLRNENGKLLVETAPGQFTTVLDGWNGQSRTFAYKFDHDRGVYRAYFR